MINHVMLDLETLGTAPGCVVLSIGAVKFRQERSAMESFSTTLNIHQQQHLGLKIDAETMCWWFKQSAVARESAFGPAGALEFSLRKFSRWYHDGPTPDQLLPPLVWGDGAAFDQPVLEAVYHAVGEPVPWSYKNVRCYRTIRGMYPDVKFALPKGLNQHVGVDDARAQALHLLKIAKRKNLVLA